MGLGAPSGCVSLGLGEPSWSMPALAAEALAAAYRSGDACPYGPNAGTPELIAALGGWLGEPAERILLTAGSQAALYALIQAWVGDGEQAIVPDPGFVAYPNLVRMAGAEPVPYPVDPSRGLDPDDLGRALDSAPQAKLAIINHPANPTGSGASVEALAESARLCAARGVVLVSDEVYRDLYLGDRPAGVLDSGPKPGVVSLGSMSKAFASPGLRVGWAVGDPEALAPARLVHNAMTSCLSRPAQTAAAAMLREADSVIAESRRQLALRWEAFSGAFEKHMPGHRRPSPPAGGFYHWLRLPESGRFAGAAEDPVSFCLKVRDEGRVIVIPGSAFGEAGSRFVRISWAGDPGETAEGLERLAPFWA